MNPLATVLSPLLLLHLLPLPDAQQAPTSAVPAPHAEAEPARVAADQYPMWFAGDRQLTSHGVEVMDGNVRASGPDYAARFDGHGVEFIPAFGQPAARTHALRFTLDSVRRGSSMVFARETAVAPAAEGNAVWYAHGIDLAEVYDVRADGIEQSFVFARRPAGDGDLVVRGRVTTELPFASASDDGVRYEVPGFGGVTFGAVTGVDANGRTARGSIRVQGDHVEWVLPAAFVDGAAYPMVLDPLIGSAFAIGNGAAGDDQRPAVAFDANSNRYLVVWNVVTGASTAEVRGQLVSAAGNLLGSSFVLDPEARSDVRPAVANVRATGRFLVGFIRNRQGAIIPVDGRLPFACSVSAATGAVSAPVVVPGIQGDDYRTTELVIGGDSRTGFLGSAENAIVVVRGARQVFGSTALYRIAYFMTHVPASGSPTFGPSLFLAGADDQMGDLAVTSHAGDVGRWCLVYARSPGGLQPFQLLFGQVINTAGGPCGLSIPIHAGTLAVGRPSIATDNGSRFAIAWEENADIRVKPMTWSGTCSAGSMTLGTTVNPLSTVVNSEPSIEFANDKYVLAWRRSVSLFGVTDVYVKGLDPAACIACGAELAVESSALAQQKPAVSAQRSGSSAEGDEALVVWSDGTIRGRRFEASSPSLPVSLGGGCGGAGLSDYATWDGDCVLGNSTFSLILAGPTSPILALIVGFTSTPLPCGPCTLIPSIDVMLPGASPTVIPIPCAPNLIGGDLYTQWLQWRPSGCPVLPDFGLSNTLKFTIRE